MNRVILATAHAGLLVPGCLNVIWACAQSAKEARASGPILIFSICKKHQDNGFQKGIHKVRGIHRCGKLRLALFRAVQMQSGWFCHCIQTQGF